MLHDWHFYYVASIANALASAADVLVVTREHGYEFGLEGDASEAKRSMLDPRVRLEVVRGRQSSIAGAASAAAVATRIRSFGPDVVHAQDDPDWRLYLLGRMFAVPHVLTVHDVVTHLGSRSRYNRLQRIVLKQLQMRASAVLVHGEKLAGLARCTLKLSDDARVVAIPLGVVCQPAKPTPLPTAPCALFFGRLEYYKGVDVLVRAAEIAVDRLPGLRIVIAGAGHDVERVRALVTRPEIFDWRVGHIPGDALPELFALSTVVVLPYREASQSGVVPLAFANGRSVIASEVGALSEAVDDGATGILVPPEDADALAEALVRFHLTPGLADGLSTRAQAVVTSGRLSSTAVATAHLRVYGSLLEEDGVS
jgi:glycosyltransferase involved in cell wall biosynthesis